MDSFEKKVFSTIRKYSLISKGDRIVVGFSGGVDSTTLLYFLNKFKENLGIELIAVHVNHLIRDIAYRDEEFCVEFCKSLDIEILTFREDVGKVAKENNMSLEEAGRFVRYSIFRNILKERNFNSIATAHHADDNVETFIFRLAKGSSITSLECIKPRNANVIRPFIQCYKEEIQEYAYKNNIRYVVDETNFDTKYERNYIRNVIIPNITKIFPSFKEKVAYTIKDFWDLGSFLNNLIEGVYNRVVEIQDSSLFVDLKRLDDYDDFVKKEIVKKILKKIGVRVSRKIIDLILSEKNFDGNKKLLKLNEYEFIREYNRLRINKVYKTDREYEKYCVKGVEIISCCKVEVEIFDVDVNPELIGRVKEESKNMVMWLSIGNAKRIVIRRRLKGDNILLEFGKKKVKDILVDEKIPLSDRENVVIVEIDGEVAGMFYSNKVRVGYRFLLKDGINRIARIILR